MHLIISKNTNPDVSFSSENWSSWLTVVVQCKRQDYVVLVQAHNLCDVEFFYDDFIIATVLASAQWED